MSFPHKKLIIQFSFSYVGVPCSLAGNASFFFCVRPFEYKLQTQFFLEFSYIFEIVRETTSSHNENIFGFSHVGSDACAFGFGREDQEEHGQVGLEKLKTISLHLFGFFSYFFRVLDIVNSELCFGVPATKCKCYTQNEA